MGHDIAKLLLQHAGSFVERDEAIKTAINLGMPLHEIQDYLDWLDRTRDPSHGEAEVESQKQQSR